MMSIRNISITAETGCKLQRLLAQAGLKRRKLMCCSGDMLMTELGLVEDDEGMSNVNAKFIPIGQFDQRNYKKWQPWFLRDERACDDPD